MLFEQTPGSRFVPRLQDADRTLTLLSLLDQDRPDQSTGLLHHGSKLQRHLCTASSMGFLHRGLTAGHNRARAYHQEGLEFTQGEQAAIGVA